ncbi:Very-long-chain 3-oxoacyl-CoA reductase [Mycena venus]|uniref:Very-long-chain 3-oxoacyl-CoA reductase n=1 Tax=Mycena venus TaxID=2733690 RepID=A0A8H6WUI8_9AGAR|nr:Very-long-chain 3-oxoacyl-CoA reductase [Mycena venus]
MNSLPSINASQSFVKTSPWWLSALLALESFAVSRFAYQTLSVLLQKFVLPGTNLAGCGFNVLPVARNTALLGAVSEEIQAKHPGTQTAVHTIDFAAANDRAYKFLVCRDRRAGCRVNNVGKSHAMPAYLVDTPLAEMDDTVKINVGATLRATSFACAVPSPMLATYSGTKAFLATFTSALTEEVRAHNIVVEHVNTYFVVSKLSKIRCASALIPTPKAYVRSVLTKIGLGCGAAYGGRPGTSTPIWSHSLMEYVLNVVGLPAAYISYTHALHKDIRRRALKNTAKAQ